MHSDLSIVKGENPKEMVVKAVDLIGGIESFVRNDEKVFIKPNLCTLKRSETGATTDPNVVSAIIDLVQKQTNDVSIIESDSPATDAEIIWAYCGFYELAREKNVRLINLSKEPSLTIKGYRLPKTLFCPHVLINVPKIKTNDLTTVTCSLKNLFGLIADRFRAKYHRNVNGAILDINRIFKSDLIVADGLVGMEGNGPIAGNPVNLNVTIAGSNAVAVDSVVCNVIGVSPYDVNHVKMAADAGMGPISMDEIEAIGERVECVRKNFSLPSTVPPTRKLKYKMLEHSDNAVLKQSINVLRWLRRKKFEASQRTTFRNR